MGCRNCFRGCSDLGSTDQADQAPDGGSELIELPELRMIARIAKIGKGIKSVTTLAESGSLSSHVEILFLLLLAILAILAISTADLVCQNSFHHAFDSGHEHMGQFSIAVRARCAQGIVPALGDHTVWRLQKIAHMGVGANQGHGPK